MNIIRKNLEKYENKHEKRKLKNKIKKQRNSISIRKYKDRKSKKIYIIKKGKINIKKINKNTILVGVILLLTIISFIWNQKKKENEEISLLEETEITDANEINQTEENEETEEKIMVHIIGAIQQEGIVEIEEGSRLVDVIQAAGGAKAEADLSQINLAYEVEDGQKIYIPTKGENISNQTYITEGIEYLNQENSQNKQAKININKATQEELETINGVGPSTAQKIIEYREENGKYKTIEDIKNVSGIGDSKFESIKEYITVK